MLLLFVDEVKKKGVRVVEGKDGPQLLFSMWQQSADKSVPTEALIWGSSLQVWRPFVARQFMLQPPQDFIFCLQEDSSFASDGCSATGASGALLISKAILESQKQPERSASCVRASAGLHLQEIPWNLFSPKAPYEGSCISKETITSKTPLVNWETCHVIMDHGGKVPYIEGQSIGVIAPGPDKKGETPAKIRLYSIASSAPGDDETNKTVSLVVKRVVEVAGRGWCEYSNVEQGQDPEFPDAEKVYRGVCSSHICDLNAGDDVLITGPTGAEMLLPEDPEANMIFMATGTGIAPFRSHLRNLFHDKVSKGKFKGCAWLFLGVPYSESLLYDEEWKEMQAEFPDQFRYDYAISSEEKSERNKINGEMWVQHKMMEYEEDLWELVKDSRLCSRPLSFKAL